MTKQEFPQGTPVTDRPLAITGLTSYRAKGRFGWIMIGGKDDADALREARRSNPDVTADALQIWDGHKYVPIDTAHKAAENLRSTAESENMPMDEEPKATKITQILKREDGSEVKIVATAMFGEGLHRSIDVYVLRRESEKHDWVLLSDKPHPDWRAMSVDEYVKGGRSEMLQKVSVGELFRAMDLIGKPMSQFETTEENLLAAEPAEVEPQHGPQG